MNKYKICGLILGTEIDFPELIETKDGNVDYTIKYGEVPDDIKNSIKYHKDNTIWYIKDKKQTLFIRGQFKCLIDNNEVIVSNKFKGMGILYYRKLLLASVLSIVSFNNNLYPIHGCGLTYKGESFIILGNTKAGKSTLNMLLQERGFKTIGDDILNIYMDNKKVYSHPGIPSVFLRDGTIDILNMWDMDKIIVRDPMWKTTFSTINNFDDNITHIRKIYNLSESNSDIYISSNINISEKIKIIKKYGYKYYIYDIIDSDKQKRMITDIANYTEIVNFKRPKDLNKINETVDFIINDIKNNE